MAKVILVIGSKGFIGSHVLSYMSNAGYVALGADLEHVQEENYFQVANPDSIHGLIRNLKIDICINCAGAASVPNSIQNPYEDFQLNVSLVAKILEAIRLYNTNCKFVNLSSAAVYGNPVKLPVSENDIPAPVSPYGFHKLQAEQTCKMFNEVYGISTASLRIFSAYGPGLKKQLFWDLYHKAQKTNCIELFGTGAESRDFIFVHDIANAIECIMDNSEFKADVVNIANNKEITINEAATTFLSIIGFKGTLSFTGKERKGDPVNWCAQTDLLAKYGYKPNTDLEQGLKIYFNWIQNQK